jgi:hypothetical protein
MIGEREQQKPPSDSERSKGGSGTIGRLDSVPRLEVEAGAEGRVSASPFAAAGRACRYLDSVVRSERRL